MKIEDILEIANNRAEKYNFLNNAEIELLVELTSVPSKEMKSLHKKGYRVLSTYLLNMYEAGQLKNHPASVIFDILDKNNQEKRKERFSYNKRTKKYSEWCSVKEKYITRGAVSMVKFNRIIDMFGRYVD